jgi:BirA family biotin operon repressor/biotin-[acetyl-CoA-carboxylase] ligase
MDDKLTETAVAATRTTQWLGRSYFYYPTIGSTNDELKKLAAANDLSEGSVVLTEFQSQGRGRLSRQWQAPAHSSLLLSLLFRPNWSAEQGAWLTMMVGLAAAEAIEDATQLTVGLKWPNDVMVQVDDEWHKVSGILLEGELSDGRLQQAIVGIGINVNIAAAQLPQTATPATSLLAATGRPINRLPLLHNFWQRLEGYYETAVSPLPAWRSRLVTLGKRVHVTPSAGTPLAGVAEDVDEWGRLLVRDEQNVLHTLAAGDVTLRRAA